MRLEDNAARFRRVPGEDGGDCNLDLELKSPASSVSRFPVDLDLYCRFLASEGIEENNMRKKKTWMMSSGGIFFSVEAMKIEMRRFLETKRERDRDVMVQQDGD